MVLLFSGIGWIGRRLSTRIGNVAVVATSAQSRTRAGIVQRRLLSSGLGSCSSLHKLLHGHRSATCEEGL